MDGGAWYATVHGVAKSRTRLSDFTSLASLSDCCEMIPDCFDLHFSIISDFGPSLWASLVVSGKDLPAKAGDTCSIPQKDPLEKEMAT